MSIALFNGGEGITFDKQILSGDYLISLAVLSIVLPFLSVCRSIAGGLFSPLRPYYCKLKVQDAWDTIKTIGVKLSRRGRLTQERKREGDRETERGLRDNFPNRIFVPAMREVDFFFRKMIEGFSPSNLVYEICHAKCD